MPDRQVNCRAFSNGCPPKEVAQPGADAPIASIARARDELVSPDRPLEMRRQELALDAYDLEQAQPGVEFDAGRWITLYLQKNFKAIVEEFLSAFSQLEAQSRLPATTNEYLPMNQVLKQFLYLFTQHDFIIDRHDADRLRAISTTITSAIARSMFRDLNPLALLLHAPSLSDIKTSILFPTRDQPEPGAAGRVQALVAPRVSQGETHCIYISGHPCELLRSKNALYPLFCRTGSSDRDVFAQIFLEREYKCLDDIQDAPLIIDCGANVGYSAAYFLTRFPRARLIAVEPDSHNYECLKLNLAPYGASAQVLQAAVWSNECAVLTLSALPYRDGREWSKQVVESDGSRLDCVHAVEIGQLLKRSGHERIAILKIDIEGAEAVVFSEHCQEWLGRVDNIVIELHDDSCFGNASEVFFKAIATQGFLISTCGELTVCRRPAVPLPRVS